MAIGTKRIATLAAVLVASALVVAGCGGNASSDPASGSRSSGNNTASGPPKQPILTGVSNGAPATYFDFGEIKLKAGNTTAAMWRVTNGAADQTVIFDNVPGDPAYSALRDLSEVTWAEGKTARVLASAADVKAAETAGDVTVKATGRVVNAPVLEFGQKRHAGYAKGQTIEYYELGKVSLAPGNNVLPIYTFTNGVADQKNIADTEPGTTAYTPLWAVVAITWRSTATPRLVKSFEEIKAAEAAGELTLKNTPDVVNCPFL